MAFAGLKKQINKANQVSIFLSRELVHTFVKGLLVSPEMTQVEHAMTFKAVRQDSRRSIHLSLRVPIVPLVPL